MQQVSSHVAALQRQHFVSPNVRLFMDALFGFPDMIAATKPFKISCCFAIGSSCHLIKVLAEKLPRGCGRMFLNRRSNVLISVYRDGDNVVANVSNFFTVHLCKMC